MNINDMILQSLDGPTLDLEKLVAALSADITIVLSDVIGVDPDLAETRIVEIERLSEVIGEADSRAVSSGLRDALEMGALLVAVDNRAGTPIGHIRLVDGELQVTVESGGRATVHTHAVRGLVPPS